MRRYRRVVSKALVTMSLLASVFGVTTGCEMIELVLPGATAPPISTSGTPIDTNWGLHQPSGEATTLSDMVAVVGRVKPSVVAIDVQIASSDIFNLPVTQQGAGSGWIIDPNGIIVTNAHVVAGARTVTVTLDDGRVFPAQQVAADDISDVAVIKVGATGLPAARLGNSSQVQVGQQVAVIGNALGQGISMTGGWVSRTEATVSPSDGSTAQTLYGLIATDAAINPGNSGGPMANIAGEVIGITSSKLVGPNIEGVGFAISIDSALPVIQQLVTTGRVVRPYFGVVLQTVNVGIATRLNIAVDHGALITSVVARSPADEAGLRQGDVIVSIGGEQVNTAAQAAIAIQRSQIGQQVEVGYWREKSQFSTQVVPVQRPD